MGLRSGLRAVLVAGGLLLAGGPALAAGEALPPPDTKFSFDGLFGSFDRASAQRGFQVYKEVCSNCHSMRLLYYRNLRELGLSDEGRQALRRALLWLDSWVQAAASRPLPALLELARARRWTRRGGHRRGAA